MLQDCPCTQVAGVEVTMLLDGGASTTWKEEDVAEMEVPSVMWSV
jgi:hypothetical protein